MKDQRLLLRKSRLNDIPAIIFQGRDSCAVDILKSAGEVYQKSGCSVEFLYDFNRLTKDFEVYSNENKDNLVLPALDNFSDKQVLNECIYTDIPVIVFQGTDSCAIEILKCAEEIYLNAGCNTEFLSGFQSFIQTFEEYEQRNINIIRTPRLSESERDFVKEDMEHDFISAVDKNNITSLKQMEQLGYQPSEEIMIAAMKKNSHVIGYFETLSEIVQLAAVQVSAYAIQEISNLTDNVLISAIQKCPEVLALIDNPSEKVKTEAVKLHPSCIQFIPEPSKEVVLAAIVTDPNAVKFCNNVSASLIKEVVEPYLNFKAAVETNDFAQFINLKEQGYQPSAEVIQSLSASFSESTLVAVQKIFRFEMETIPNFQPIRDSLEKEPRHLSNDMAQSI